MAAENDLVLIYYEDKPALFARIEIISPDVKPGWYNIKLLLLQIPVQTITWTLKDAYINGDEFSMGGKNMRLELVESPDKLDIFETDDIIKKESKSEKVISLVDRKK